MMRRGTHRGERGLYMVIFALTLATIIGFAGLGVNAGKGYVEQRTLQRADDAGALAGAEVLGTATRDASGVQGEGGAGRVVCTQAMIAVLQALALNGVVMFDASAACGNNSGAHCYGTYFLSIAGNVLFGVPGTTAPNRAQYDVIFYDAAGHPGNAACTASEPWTTQTELVSPPLTQDIPPGSECTAHPFNCVEVVSGSRIGNYLIMGGGIARTTVRNLSLAYGLSPRNWLR